MTVHEILVAARNIQERRGYQWLNGVVHREGPCCPGCCIAEAIGELSFVDVKGHPAALELARRLDPTGDTASVSLAALHCCLSLTELLACYDEAIAATAPAPDVSFIKEPVHVH